MPLELRFQAKSDVGLVRRNNEDAYVSILSQRLGAVCDGLGGHLAGEIASRIAAEALRENLLANVPDDSPAQIRKALQEANRQILEDQRKNPEHLGMGTTVSLLWFPYADRAEAWIGHIGDSRIYRLRDGELLQLTCDHSPIFRLFQEGKLTKDDLRRHPQKNLIERSLGLSAALEADVFSTELLEGDLYLLCSDGLSDFVSDRDISRALAENEWEQLSEALVEAALEAGGFDNITVVMAQVLRLS